MKPKSKTVSIVNAKLKMPKIIVRPFQIRNYFLVLTYLAVLMVFWLVSMANGGFFTDINMFSLSAILLKFFGDELSQIALMIFAVMMIAEPLVISGFLLNVQYKKGDLQNQKTRNFFSTTVVLCYIFYMIAGFYCSDVFCNAMPMIAAMPGLVVYSLMPGPIGYSLASLMAETVPITLQAILLALPNAILIWLITSKVLSSKSKKELHAVSSI